MADGVNLYADGSFCLHRGNAVLKKIAFGAVFYCLDSSV